MRLKYTGMNQNTKVFVMITVGVFNVELYGLLTGITNSYPIFCYVETSGRRSVFPK